jgi:hypothetical protein
MQLAGTLQETAEQVTSLHSRLGPLTEEGEPGRQIRWLQPSAR